MPAEPYLFKLQFPDRRWQIAVKDMASEPSEGECVELGAEGRWRVVGRESVRARPSGKPDNLFFVCAPA
jgi:hypothetical protein